MSKKLEKIHVKCILLHFLFDTLHKIEYNTTRGDKRMYSFNIKRYFSYEDDLSLMINAYRRKMNISRSDLSKALSIPNSTIRDNEQRYRNLRLIEKCKNFFNIDSFSDFNIISSLENYMNNIYIAIIYMQTDALCKLIKEVEEKFIELGKNNFLGVMVDLIIMMGYGSFNVLHNEEMNKQMFTSLLNKLQWFNNDLLPEHQFFIHSYSALLASKNRCHEFAIEQLKKAKAVVQDNQKPLMYYQAAIIYQFAGEYSSALYYAQESKVISEKTNNLERLTHIRNNIVWSYIKLKNYDAAHDVISTFLPLASISDNNKFRISTFTNYAYLLYFEYEFEKSYHLFKQLDINGKYECKAMLFLLSLKLTGKGEYINEISKGYLNKSCWSGYYIATLYFQSIYSYDSDYDSSQLFYEELMIIFKNNTFTSIYDVIVKEHQMYSTYHKHKQFIELQRNSHKLRIIESNTTIKI